MSQGDKGMRCMILAPLNKAILGVSGSQKVRQGTPFLLPVHFVDLLHNNSVSFGCIGKARHLGPKQSCRPRQISVKFLKIGGWLTRGDLATDSQSHFPIVAEHPLFLPRARAVANPTSFGWHSFSLGSCMQGFYPWRSFWGWSG